MKILVIGDVILDEFRRYKASRISPEAPVPVGVFESSSYFLGGAANVAHNLTSLGSEVLLVAPVGKDTYAETIKKLCVKKGINIDFTFSLKQTSYKKRVVVNGQQLLRIDQEDISTLPGTDIHHLNLEYFDMIVISDYSKGAVNTEIIQYLKSRFKGLILCDPKGSNWDKYKGIDVLTPNEKELGEIIGTWTSEDELILKAQSLITSLQLNYILLTRSEKGILLLSKNTVFKSVLQVKKVIDVSGAGDSVMAAFAHYLGYFGYENAAYLANVAGSIAVTKYATSTVSCEDIKSFVSSNSELSGVYSLMVKKQLENLKVVFTNGCFDFLHQGHVHVLKEAKKLGDKLIVGLNSDKSVSKLKGPNRPLQHELIRKEALISTGLVDEVIIFDDLTPIELIKKILPDVLVKGGDYSPSEIVGHDFVFESGGEIKIIPLLE